MLRISSVIDKGRLRLVVEGKLVAPWAAELKDACDKAKTQSKCPEVVVDLRNLTVISQEGENVLLELMKVGVKVCGCGVFTNYVLTNLARRAHVKLAQPS